MMSDVQAFLPFAASAARADLSGNNAQIATFAKSKPPRMVAGRDRP